MTTTTNVSANLNISPKRITFDRAGRSASVFIFNQGTGIATFDISLVDRVMLPDGRIEAVSEAETKPELNPYIAKLRSAKPMLVAAPRRATLEPGRGQTIRLRVTPAPATVTGAAAPTGEYRTHLTITTLPPRDIGFTAEQAAAGNTRELRFRINTVFGISIPVILRLGALDVRGALENPTLITQAVSADGASAPKPTPVLRFQLVRVGANSLFGNLEVRGAKEKGSKEPLGTARGVGVYPEIDRRQIEIPLKRTPLPAEKIEITFTDDDATPGRLIAKTVLTSP